MSNFACKFFFSDSHYTTQACKALPFAEHKTEKDPISAIINAI